MIRAAVVADARAIADIHVRCWQHAYRGLLPADHLDALSSEQRAGRWRALLGSGAPTWVYTRDGAIAGFVSAGPARGEPEGVGEVYAIYLEPAMIGLGLGRALMTHAVGQLRASGFEQAILWVLESNALGRRFYEAAGWRADGAAKDERIGAAEVREVRYRTSLSGDGGAATSRSG